MSKYIEAVKAAVASGQIGARLFHWGEAEIPRIWRREDRAALRAAVKAVKVAGEGTGARPSVYRQEGWESQGEFMVWEGGAAMRLSFRAARGTQWRPVKVGPWTFKDEVADGAYVEPFMAPASEHWIEDAWVPVPNQWIEAMARAAAPVFGAERLDTVWVEAGCPTFQE